MNISGAADNLQGRIISCIICFGSHLANLKMIRTGMFLDGQYFRYHHLVKDWRNRVDALDFQSRHRQRMGKIMRR
jgi:hypothetical protein